MLKTSLNNLKKGQLEIIGFLVIVIMIVFIGFIFMAISSQPKEDINREIRESIGVRNLLNSLMKYKHCDIASSKKFSEVVRDCYLLGEDYCGVKCDDYIKNTLKEICDSYGCPGYFFEIKNKEEVFLRDGECKGNIKTSEYNIMAGSEYLIFKLGVCER
jgi:hypothetical protein